MFTGELTEAQISPANRLCGWKRVLLAYPQGTGKTVMAIAAAEKLFELGLISRAIVLAPAGIAWQWRKEIRNFTDHDDIALVDRKKKGSRNYSEITSRYVIIPYSLFRRDYKEIKGLGADLIIADEGQEFSNMRSKTSKVIRQFKPEYRWVLTGTAISNKLEELYGLFLWIDPYFLPPWDVFEKRHIVRNKNTKQIVAYKNLEGLHKYLKAKRMVRKSLEEIQDQLPRMFVHERDIPKSQEVIEAERNLYEALVSMASSGLEFDPAASKALHAARQATSGSKAKLAYCAELCHSIIMESSNNRVVVFCFYKQPLRDLQLQQLVSSTFFTGDQSGDQKQAAIDEFESGEAKVLLCSNAGSTGLDLPFANYVIHLDVPYSHGIMDQRKTRVQRTSSSFSTVINYFLLVEDSIEPFYMQAAKAKGYLAKAVQETGEDSIVIKKQSLKGYLEDYYG